MSIVQFPEGGAYLSAPLGDKDERLFALIRRSLAAYRALDRDCSRLHEDDSPAAQSELHRLHAAVSKAEDELAALVEPDLMLRGWLEECVGDAVENSHYRREQRAKATAGPRRRP
jgi:hypothetical protein